jgi:alpha-glucoside transport system substrate-binding protein
MGELLRHGTEAITPLSPPELERTIDGPAEALGVRFEPGLVAQIVADVVDRQGSLPLLQYALTELFDRRTGDRIGLSAYLDVGGVSGALARRAEALHAELDDAAQDTARRLLLRLVSIGEGGELARRRVLRRELVALLGPAAEAVLETFGRHRLLTFDRDPATREPTVELAHEALLSVWARLAAWVDEGRDDLRHERRLSAAAAEWSAADEDAGYLLRGPLLEQLAAWVEARQPLLHAGERRFLEASVAQRDHERAAEEVRRRREHGLQRTNRRRTRQLSAAAAVLVVLAVVATVAVVRRSEAGREADVATAVAEARRLATAATGVVADDPTVATLLALTSLDTSARAGVPALPEAEEALHWAVQARGLVYPATGAPVETRDGPDGLTGIYRLPLDDLVELAREGIDRPLSAAECASHDVDPCPSSTDQLAVPAAAPGGGASPSAAPLAGTHLTILGLDEAHAGLREELDRFEAETGIEVRLLPGREEEAVGGGESGEVPDLAAWSQPGAVRELADAGRLVDLGAYVDVTEAERTFGAHLTGVGRAGSGWYGIPLSVSLKGLVWYRPEQLAAAGYELPTTWPELVALGRAMTADGRTPWCVGFESDVASGWPATDWVEALVLRLGGVEQYDRWAAHQVPFDDPTVRAAAAAFGDVLFADGSVRGGPARAVDVGFDLAIAPMFEDPPGCWLHLHASSVERVLPDGMRAGRDLAYVPLPPMAPGGEAPAFGGADLLTALTDRPEVRELVRRVLSPTWGEVWASHPGSDFLPASTGFDVARCADPGGDAAANDVRIRLCTDARDSLAAGSWRFDASDLMPGAVGAGSFWSEMTAWIAEDKANEDVLSSIEASWPAS